MDPSTVDKYCLKTSKKFLVLAGLWPSQKVTEKYILRFIIVLVSISSLFTQGARVVNMFSVNTIVEQIPFSFTVVLLLIKEQNYIRNALKLSVLLDNIYKDFNSDRDEEEYDILKKYYQRGNLYSSIYKWNAYICGFLFVQVPWSARLINKFTQYNITVDVVVPGHYFIDEEKYSYFIIFHGSIAVFVLMIVFIACDTTYMILVQHACGLFAITGYRFKYAVSNNSSDKTYLKSWIKEAQESVRSSIRGHQHAIKFLKEIENIHDVYLFICLGMVIICFSITLLRFTVSDSNPSYYRDLIFLLAQLIHLFIITLQGQFVIDSCDEIHDMMYESLWYNCPSKIQALYVFALRSNLSPPRLSAGGLIPLNMQCFSEVVKMSVSYYTVLNVT